MNIFRALAVVAFAATLANDAWAQTPGGALPMPFVAAPQGYYAPQAYYAPQTYYPTQGYYYVAQAQAQMPAEVVPAPRPQQFPVQTPAPNMLYGAPGSTFDPYAAQMPPAPMMNSSPPGMYMTPDGGFIPAYPLPGSEFGCDPCGNYCTPGGPVWELFFAGDAWADKGDDNHGNNFGVRTGINFAQGFGNSGIIAQLGGSIGAYNLDGREVTDPFTGGSDSDWERQVFITAGLGHRANPSMGTFVTWGLVFDYLNDNRWGEMGSSIDPYQLRGRLGFVVGERSEIGVWGTYNLSDATALSGRIGPITVSPIQQANLYWEHHWDRGAETMLYLGWADSVGDFVLGMRGEAPLNDYVALFGNAHYISPSASAGDGIPPNDNRYSEATWNITFGFVYYPGGKAPCYINKPLFGVADNGTFALGAPTGEL